MDTIATNVIVATFKTEQAAQKFVQDTLLGRYNLTGHICKIGFSFDVVVEEKAAKAFKLV